MKSAIEKLLLQNSQYLENIPLNDAYWQIISDCSELYNKFKETLSDEQAELFDKLSKKQAELGVESVDSHLIEGFKTGLRLMIECL